VSPPGPVDDETCRQIAAALAQYLNSDAVWPVTGVEDRGLKLSAADRDRITAHLLEMVIRPEPT
jgi:hypothetical protein